MLRQLRANVACLDALFGDRPPGGTASFFDLDAQRDLLGWIDHLRAEAGMSDLREGVSLAQHQALDLLDQLRASQAGLFPVQHLELGGSRAKQAHRTTNANNRRHFALQAAAHLILSVELLDAVQAADAARAASSAVTA